MAFVRGAGRGSAFPVTTRPPLCPASNAESERPRTACCRWRLSNAGLGVAPTELPLHHADVADRVKPPRCSGLTVTSTPLLCAQRRDHLSAGGRFERFAVRLP